MQGSAGGSGDPPIPNPDSIQEFKIQTALYDAGFGRCGGANLRSITKNSAAMILKERFFEFLRNEFINANDFLLNQTGQPRQKLKQDESSDR